VLWEIHRPLRGWYIRLRSPRFPPNVFVPLIPVPPTSPYHRPGSLKFSCRTSVSSPASPPLAPVGSPSPHLPGASHHAATDSETTLTDASPNAQFSPTHTYPPAPTPPRSAVSPPSPSVVHAKLNQLAQPCLAISQFILSPHTQAAPPPASEGLFSRALRALRNNAPTSTNSFSLSPLPDGPPLTPVHEGKVHHDLECSQAWAGPTPLLIFEDTTPVFSVSSSTGALEVHLDEIGKLGVDLAFWIAVALAYCEFLGDREVSRTITHVSCAPSTVLNPYFSGIFSSGGRLGVLSLCCLAHPYRILGIRPCSCSMSMSSHSSIK